jgi:hypothetical protein
MEFQKETQLMAQSYFKCGLSNVFYDDDFNQNDSEMANFIKDNLSHIKDDDTMLFSIAKKIIPRSRFVKDLITYEFLYSEPIRTINTRDELIVVANSELSRYQGVVGGFAIEDEIWLKCSDSTRFKMQPNQKGLYNSISKEQCDDKKLLWFLKNFVIHMKKFLLETSNISLNYKIVDDDSNEICWILFIFEQRNK